MSEKTEDPTPQRIRKAREEGQVARSKDFTQTVLVIALFGYTLGNAESIVRDIAGMIVLPAGVMQMDFDLAVNAVATLLLRKAILLLAPYLGIVIGLGLLVEFGQTGMLFSVKAMKPSGKRLNVLENAKNIVGVKNLFEFLKSNLKVVLLSVIVYMVLGRALPTLPTLPGGGLTAVGVATAMLLKTLMLNVALGYTVLALADFVWQRHQYIRGLRMSKEEVKQEYKDAEGDPHIKHKRRELHQELLENAEVDHVKKASVVVTNPTHLAVAIVYEKDVTPLPMVIAKGEGEHAFRIAKAAREHGVPVLQNIPLARALMANASLNEFIPSDLIAPVAEVLRLIREMNEDPT